MSSGSSNTVLRMAATSASTAPRVARKDFMHPRSASREARRSNFSFVIPLTFGHGHFLFNVEHSFPEKLAMSSQRFSSRVERVKG